MTIFSKKGYHGCHMVLTLECGPNLNLNAHCMCRYMSHNMVAHMSHSMVAHSRSDSNGSDSMFTSDGEDERWEMLPGEILTKVLSWVHGLRDVFAMSMVCRRWGSAVYQEVVWERLSRHRWRALSRRPNLRLQGWRYVHGALNLTWVVRPMFCMVLNI